MTSLRPRQYRPRSERQQQTVLTPQSRRTPALNAVISTASVDTNDLTLVFDRPVVLRSTPALTGITTDVAGVSEASAAQTAEDTVVITFDGSIAAATQVNMPNPPTDKIRTSDGGWVQSGSFLIPT